MSRLSLVKWAAHAVAAAVQHVGADHRRTHSVAHQLLDGGYVLACCAGVSRRNDSTSDRGPRPQSAARSSWQSLMTSRRWARSGSARAVRNIVTGALPPRRRGRRLHPGTTRGPSRKGSGNEHRPVPQPTAPRPCRRACRAAPRRGWRSSRWGRCPSRAPRPGGRRRRPPPPATVAT